MVPAGPSPQIQPVDASGIVGHTQQDFSRRSPQKTGVLTPNQHLSEPGQPPHQKRKNDRMQT